jgi:glycosidase family protein
MAWFDEAIFYHIYPLGETGAPKENHYNDVKSRLNDIYPWLEHIKEMGFNALYIGPLFESVGHGYETTDYKKLDSRLGVNYDLQRFVKTCHERGIKVILDGVFNHTGRDFFAFRDLKEKRENSIYKDWYCNVNFYGNNEYNDGFSYDNWGGFNLLVKLNYKNPAVSDYMCEVVKFWIDEFDIDGIRLDAADVLDFDFMKKLRKFTESLKPDFWLMGEVIHGDYQRWANAQTLHSVTNYQLHKALYSGYNDHNYFEIAHTVNRFIDMCKNGIKLYNFVDNHDVERIFTKLNNKDHMIPVHILLFTLFGIPSVYYGSEFCVEGKKEKFSDDSLRPMLNIEYMKDMKYHNKVTNTIMKLANLRQSKKVFSRGDYKELLLTNRQYAFSMSDSEDFAIVAVNNDENAAYLRIPLKDNRFEGAKFKGQLSGATYTVNGGVLECNLDKCMGEVFCLE